MSKSTRPARPDGLFAYIRVTADTPISEMDRFERVVWLKHHGVVDEQILDALLDPADPELEQFTTELSAALEPQGLSDG